MRNPESFLNHYLKIMMHEKIRCLLLLQGEFGGILVPALLIFGLQDVISYQLVEDLAIM